MTSYDRNDGLRKRLSKYDSTRPKMDPLFVKHAKNYQSQKRVKSRVQEMITNLPTQGSMNITGTDIPSSRGRLSTMNDMSASKRNRS